jgi:SAM-dependent MidA family methyltransferase
MTLGLSFILESVATSPSAVEVCHLSSGNTALIETIRQEIRKFGPISFARFMELALYHPEYGYYSSDCAALGRHGDYFTNVSVGPVFAQLLASQFVEIWEGLGKPSDFVFVEQGAHHGDFARDLLQAFRLKHPEFSARLRYHIVEPFAHLQQRQRETLSEFAPVLDWSNSIDALPPFRGVHFSNELFDALPVHVIVAAPDPPESKCAPPWMERRVGLEQNNFVFVHQPITEPALREHAGRLPIRPAGYVTEINLNTLRLVRDLSRKLIRGFMIAIDYGFPGSEFYDEQRSAGTLQCRAQHHLLESPFTNVGQADITAHVEWSSLVKEAEASGFALAGFSDQHHFLTGLLAVFPGIVQEGSPKERRALQTLLHPEMLGRSFQILALARNVEPPIALSGFKFAREARRALDL